MYKYEEQKQSIFTEDGQVMFLRIRDHVQKLLRLSGAITMGNAISAPGVSGDSWKILACVDRLVEIGELKEVIQSSSIAGQNRIFVSGSN